MNRYTFILEFKLKVVAFILNVVSIASMDCCPSRKNTTLMRFWNNPKNDFSTWKTHVNLRKINKGSHTTMKNNFLHPCKDQCTYGAPSMGRYQS